MLRRLFGVVLHFLHDGGQVVDAFQRQLSARADALQEIGDGRARTANHFRRRDLLIGLPKAGPALVRHAAYVRSAVLLGDLRQPDFGVRL